MKNLLSNEDYKLIERLVSLTQDEVRIVICGDIVHNKLTISNDQMVLVANFIRELEKIAKVIVISGNHDTIINNVTKKDTLSGVFETAQFENAFYLDFQRNHPIFLLNQILRQCSLSAQWKRRMCREIYL